MSLTSLYTLIWMYFIGEIRILNSEESPFYFRIVTRGLSYPEAQYAVFQNAKYLYSDHVPAEKNKIQALHL